MALLQFNKCQSNKRTLRLQNYVPFTALSRRPYGEAYIVESPFINEHGDPMWEQAPIDEPVLLAFLAKVNTAKPSVLLPV